MAEVDNGGGTAAAGEAGGAPEAMLRRPGWLAWEVRYWALVWRQAMPKEQVA